jgi:hypothetical protein
MNGLVEFAKRVKAALTHSGREPHWAPGEAEQYMADVESRRRRFEERAAQVFSTVIEPRLEVLCGSFPNACRTNEKHDFHAAYWFGFSERFPASTRVALGVEHDVRIEKLVVAYSASMIPQFTKLNEGDRLTLPLDEAQDGIVASWVEDRLLEFLDAYLRIDRGGDDFADESTTDPVCGMRIARSSAAASDTYRGASVFLLLPGLPDKVRPRSTGLRGSASDVKE